MNIITTPSRVLNPTYRKVNIIRNEINRFKSSLLECLEHIKISDEKNEHEENIKKYIGDFLQKTFYQNYLINTKDRVDLAIYAGKNAKSNISVLIETKRPSNTNEFLKNDNINKKALQELLLYYLRERIDLQNNQIKYLIATNGYEWYFFKGNDFYDFFYKNKKLIKEYNEFVKNQKDSSKNELFYNEIAKKYIEEVKNELPFLYINIKENYEKLLPLSNTKDDQLVSLYKVFSPIHLLAQSYGNDSNELNHEFYFELLHIIGLEEVQKKGVKLIERKKKKNRNIGSLLETTIFILEDRNYIKKVKNLQNYGEDREEQLFNVALELCLTWINRILFLKLLEAQLVVYNKSKEYEFLNTDFIQRFNDLEDLFFSALAKKPEERNEERIKEKYKNIPYLNSSLFEPNELEDTTLQISNINGVELEIYDKTVLKNDLKHNLKPLTGKIPLLSYIFRFLDAYDFSGKDQNKVDETNQGKTLISASVLGLIFEKINGYKEGSFYTPAYITMYMARETLRKTVLQKFNAHYGWEYENFDYLREDFFNHIRKGNREVIRKEANQIINSIKICDPAVGSGHFLVSCLNELIVIKSELNILVDKSNNPLQVHVQIDSDELVIKNQDDEIFIYRPKSFSNTIIQETLFHEKQTLIESCLFGVDINPNSVKICRLRLWIELLKNAYYINYKKNKDLQTLPNIDINIKTGNSLISKFHIDDKMNFFGNSLSVAVKRNIPDYKIQTELYKSVRDKETRWVINKSLNEHRLWFDNLRSPKDKEYVSLQKLKNKFTDYGMSSLAKQNILDKMAKEIKKLEAAYDKKMEIYRKAFEWRFAFPEVLDDEGKFIGFDVIIGNPPYFSISNDSTLKKVANLYDTYNSAGDIYALFVELSQKILKPSGISSFIISNKWLRANYGENLRKYLVDKTNPVELIDFGQNLLFESAIVHTNIITTQKQENNNNLSAVRFPDGFFDAEKVDIKSYVQQNKIQNLEIDSAIWNIISPNLKELKSKIEKSAKKLMDWKIIFYRGILTGYNEAFIIDSETKNELINKDAQNETIIKPILRGRDTRKYFCNYANLYLLNTHNGYKNIERVDVINDFPSVYDYLKTHEKNAAKRFDKGVHWTNLRNCAYLDKFDTPKIIFSEIVSEPQFYYDEKGYYPEATTFFISGEKLEYLTGLLNSKAVTFFFKSFYMGGELVGKIRYKKAFLEQVPLPYPTKKQENQVTDLVTQILKSKSKNPNADTSDLENQIDILVYKLYQLTDEEILIIDSDFDNQKN